MAETEPTMSAKPPSVSPACKMKRNRQTITLEKKLKIITQYEEGKPIMTLVRETGYSKSTVTSIVKNRKRISDAVKSSTPIKSTIITKQRLGPIEQMEKLLVVWVKDQLEKRMPLSLSSILDKARSLYATLKESHGPTCTKVFIASPGWYQRFQRRYNFYNMMFSDKAVSPSAEGPTDVKGVRLKRRRIKLTPYQKQDICHRLENGESQRSLMREYSIGKSTIAYVRAQSEELETFLSAEADYRAMAEDSAPRGPGLQQLEEALRDWCQVKQYEGFLLSAQTITDKAKEIYASMNTDLPWVVSESWLSMFQNRYGIRTHNPSEECKMNDSISAQEFCEVVIKSEPDDRTFQSDDNKSDQEFLGKEGSEENVSYEPEHVAIKCEPETETEMDKCPADDKKITRSQTKNKGATREQDSTCEAPGEVAGGERNAVKVTEKTVSRGEALEACWKLITFAEQNAFLPGEMTHLYSTVNRVINEGRPNCDKQIDSSKTFSKKLKEAVKEAVSCNVKTASSSKVKRRSNGDKKINTSQTISKKLKEAVKDAVSCNVNTASSPKVDEGRPNCDEQIETSNSPKLKEAVKEPVSCNVEESNPKDSEGRPNCDDEIDTDKTFSETSKEAVKEPVSCNIETESNPKPSILDSEDVPFPSVKLLSSESLQLP